MLRRNWPERFDLPLHGQWRCQLKGRERIASHTVYLPEAPPNQHASNTLACGLVESIMAGWLGPRGRPGECGPLPESIPPN